jgi:hypothetical protein
MSNHSQWHHGGSMYDRERSQSQPESQRARRASLALYNNLLMRIDQDSMRTTLFPSYCIVYDPAISHQAPGEVLSHPNITLRTKLPTQEALEDKLHPNYITQFLLLCLQAH